MANPLSEMYKRKSYRDFAGFQIDCMQAINTAAAKLGMDPAVLAERCANGEIGTLAWTSRNLLGYANQPCPHYVREECESALKPFTKE